MIVTIAMSKEKINLESILIQIEHDYEVQIRKFRDGLCKSLEDTTRKQLVPRNKHCSKEEFAEVNLKRTRGVDGYAALPKTVDQRASGRNIGAVASNVFFNLK